MKIYQQNRSVNFILKLLFIRQKLFGQPVKEIDLFGYNSKLILSSQKKILVNNTYDSLVYTSEDGSKVIETVENSIVINLNCASLHNSVYTGKIFIYNENYSFSPFNFQLNLTTYSSQTNLILTESILISGENYRLIELNSSVR